MPWKAPGREGQPREQREQAGLSQSSTFLSLERWGRSLLWLEHREHKGAPESRIKPQAGLGPADSALILKAKGSQWRSEAKLWPDRVCSSLLDCIAGRQGLMWQQQGRNNFTGQASLEVVKRWKETQAVTSGGIAQSRSLLQVQQNDFMQTTRKEREIQLPEGETLTVKYIKWRSTDAAITERQN